MDTRFKKKPLKFCGKAAAVRASEMNSARKSFRQTQYSVQRNIEDEPEKASRVGIPKATRVDMLKKWQEEKQFKKRMENISKKPAFKVGVSMIPPRGVQGLQESKTESFSSKTLTPNRSISKALQASRSYPSTKLGEITHPKDRTAESEAKASVKISRVPSFKPQIAKLQENKVKTIPSAASNIKPQSTVGVRIPSATSNFKPQSSLGAKVPVSGIAKPLTFPPQRKPINQQNKPKPVSSLPTKSIKSKVSNKPLHQNPEAEKPKGSSEMLFSTHLSRIEPEESFAPPDYVFRPPKIRNSWLDDEGPCAILSRVRKEMETKQRTSTPLKKQEAIESGTDTSITGESSIDKSTPLKNQNKETESSITTSITGDSAKKEYSTIPCSDTRFIESLINSSAAEVPESEREAALNSKSRDTENKELLTELVSSSKEETPVLITSGLENKELLPENVPLIGPAPEKESSVEEETTDIASGLENKECVPDISPVKENVPMIREPCVESVNKIESAEDESLDESVFLPAEPAPETSVRRVTRSLWRMEKPSLALISESPENAASLMATPKSRRRKNFLAEGFSPRRSMRLAKKGEKEDNIFDVEACFLDSPSVEAATRMSMASNTYDFEKLHLEPEDGAVQSNGSTSAQVPSSTHSRKVSLLYTPPRLRQSTRIKSLKEDLMSFSPNE